jgi:hypothetical protein
MARDFISPDPRPAKPAFVSVSFSTKNTPSTRLFFPIASAFVTFLDLVSLVASGLATIFLFPQIVLVRKLGRQYW